MPPAIGGVAVSNSTFMHLLIVLLFVAFASPAWAQVRVDVKPSKDTYLQGEPIFVDVTVTNVGEYPIAQGGGAIGVDIPGRVAYEWRRACDSFQLLLTAPRSSSTHPPYLHPGRSFRERLLLQGYRLMPGRHELRVHGEVGVFWRQLDYMPEVRPSPPPPRIPFSSRDPVPGKDVDTLIPIEVAAAGPGALQKVMEPLVASAQRFLSDNHLDRLAIYEAAHPFLLDVFATLAKSEEYAGSPLYEALADINTPEARALLRRIFDETDSTRLRADIVDALRRTANADNVAFFLSILPGRYEANPGAKSQALAGLRCLGASNIGSRLVAASVDWPTEQRLGALRMAAVPEAVDAVLNTPMDDTLDGISAVCRTLASLTHHACDMERWMVFIEEPVNPSRVRAMIRGEQALWRRWWAANRNRIRLHGPDDKWQGPGDMPIIK